MNGRIFYTMPLNLVANYQHKLSDLIQFVVQVLETTTYVPKIKLSNLYFLNISQNFEKLFNEVKKYIPMWVF